MAENKWKSLAAAVLPVVKFLSLACEFDVSMLVVDFVADIFRLYAGTNRTELQVESIISSNSQTVKKEHKAT